MRWKKHLLSIALGFAYGAFVPPLTHYESKPVDGVVFSTEFESSWLQGDTYRAFIFTSDGRYMRADIKDHNELSAQQMYEQVGRDAELKFHDESSDFFTLTDLSDQIFNTSD